MDYGTGNYTVYYSTGGHDSDRNKSRSAKSLIKCFMNKISKTNKIILMLAICATIGIIIMNKIDKKKINKIVSNSSYTVGTVQFYSSCRGGIFVPKVISSSSKPAEVKFSYNVNGKKYTNRYNGGFFKMPLEGIQKGEQYLVIYNVHHPDKSLILFDYPIKNETDLDRYMEKFKTNPPDFKFR